MLGTANADLLTTSFPEVMLHKRKPIYYKWLVLGRQLLVRQHRYYRIFARSTVLISEIVAARKTLEKTAMSFSVWRTQRWRKWCTAERKCPSRMLEKWLQLCKSVLSRMFKRFNNLEGALAKPIRNGLCYFVLFSVTKTACKFKKKR